MELAKLKLLLGIVLEDASQDAFLQFIMDDVEEMVKNYCKLQEVPQGLYNTCYRMAMDIYRAEGIGEADTPLSVSSITEGDTSTSFGSSRTEWLKDTLLKDYKAQLNAYRKLRWQ
ncbi:MAG: phage head-tail connector protein [bacterium]|nr:phage head-tail connector protein [bacterium]